MRNMKEVVTFFLSGKKYSVDVSWLQGIENYKEVSPVSGMPDFLLGTAVIRDEIIPVLDIKKRLVLPVVPVTKETKYLVFGTKSGKLAVVADGVSGIVQADGGGLQDCPELVHTKATSYVDFVVNHEGVLVLAINPEGLLVKEEWDEVDKMLKGMSEEE